MELKSKKAKSEKKKRRRKKVGIVESIKFFRADETLRSRARERDTRESSAEINKIKRTSVRSTGEKKRENLQLQGRK